MSIHNDGIRFSREILRPNHDHSNSAEFLVKDGKAQWIDTDWDRDCFKYEPFRVEFGPSNMNL